MPVPSKSRVPGRPRARPAYGARHRGTSRPFASRPGTSGGRPGAAGARTGNAGAGPGTADGPARDRTGRAPASSAHSESKACAKPPESVRPPPRTLPSGKASSLKVLSRMDFRFCVLPAPSHRPPLPTRSEGAGWGKPRVIFSRPDYPFPLQRPLPEVPPAFRGRARNGPPPSPPPPQEAASVPSNPEKGCRNPGTMGNRSPSPARGWAENNPPLFQNLEFENRLVPKCGTCALRSENSRKALGRRPRYPPSMPGPSKCQCQGYIITRPMKCRNLAINPKVKRSGKPPDMVSPLYDSPLK
jgi:hypothetical protein